MDWKDEGNGAIDTGIGCWSEDKSKVAMGSSSSVGVYTCSIGFELFFYCFDRFVGWLANTSG